MSNKNNDELQRQASENTLGLNPVIGIRRKDLLSSARTVLRQAVRQPLHSAKHVAHFGLELKNVLLGKSTWPRKATTVASMTRLGATTHCTAATCKPTWPGAMNYRTGSAAATCHPRTSAAASSSST